MGDVKILTTKIKCIQVYSLVDTKGFKQGDVYDVINGKLILPDGNESRTTFDCIEQINESFYAYFKEIKEDET